MKNNTRKQTLNLYFDRNGDAFFYKSKTQTAYFIPEKDLTMAYIVVYRYLIALSFVAVLGTLFNKSLIYAVIAGLLIYSYLEYYYQKKMLGTYRFQHPYTPYQSKQQKADSLSRPKLILRVVSYYVLAILVFASIYFEKNEGTSLVVMVLIGGVSIVAGTQNLLSYLKRN